MAQRTMQAEKSLGPLLVGRDQELDTLREILDESGPRSLTYLHGIAGIGKSSLLFAFVSMAQAKGAQVLALDCRTIEPTERGLLDAIAHATGTRHQNLETVALSLRESGRVSVIAFDNYEVFRLMDTWLRQVFVPALPDNVRLVFSSREPPVAAWLVDPALSSPTRVIPLGPLSKDHALRLLEVSGVPTHTAERLNQIVRGHPLAIKLAASTLIERPDLGVEDVAAHRAIHELTRIYLADVRNPLTRSAIEAASVLRRATLSLFGAMLPDVRAEDALQQLEGLPFTETRHDGLVVHEAVREAVASGLKATDPTRYRDLRRAAWRQMRTEVGQAGTAELWRYTADMLYMIENPLIREAFFPSESQPLAVEPARSEDAQVIRSIATRHDGDTAARMLDQWWHKAPESFSVTKDRNGAACGFFSLLEMGSLLPPAVPDDPVVRTWLDHMKSHPIPRGQQVLGLRRWLDLDHGEAPCATQAACWLDVKRCYMTMRPHLRRIYVVVEQASVYWPIVEKLAFSQITGGQVELDGRTYTSVVLDFGPASVDGWLAELVAEQLGIDTTAGIDEETREVAVDGRRVALTPLEFGVLKCLDAFRGRAVSRVGLLNEVWGYDFAGDSNVVNVVVTGLRRKLGPHQSVIETVRGVGYRLPEGWQSTIS